MYNYSTSIHKDISLLSMLGYNRVFIIVVICMQRLCVPPAGFTVAWIPSLGREHLPWV